MRPLLESLAAAFRLTSTPFSPRQHAFTTTARNARARLQAAKPRSRRPYSNTPHSNPSSSSKANASTTTTTATTTAQAEKATQRAERILFRLPRPLQRYATRLRGAPLTHVAAFLVLHEITAVVPLLGLFGLFHYGVAGAHLPVEYLMRNYGGYVEEGASRWERYFKRKGWFGFGQDTDGGAVNGVGREGEGEEALRQWRDQSGVDDPRYRVVVEVALAYTITKVLLPVRIVASVWATPWFAGVLMRLGRVTTQNVR